MNIERLEVIIDYLRNPPANRTHGFNMCNWNSDKNPANRDLLGDIEGCNTVCCVAGLACVLWPDEFDDDYYGGFDHEAAAILGLNGYQAARLFHGGALNLADITPGMAIETIEKLIRTGDVIWSVEQ